MVGPTLLDLKDIVGATIGEVSFILMVNSIGSLVGCFSTGFLLDRFSKFRYLILGGSFYFILYKSELESCRNFGPVECSPVCVSLLPLSDPSLRLLLPLWRW